MVTAELTVAIPTLLGLVLVLVQVLGVLVLSARCADAARAGARAAARGEAPAAVAARCTTALPGARVLVRQQGTLLLVRVSTVPRLLPGLGWLLPSRLVTAQAAADAESATDAGSP